MADKKYQTIDPLILQTLNLNEKRIHHIFDILHGRDLRPQTDRTARSIGHTKIDSKLPKIIENENNSNQKYHFIKPKIQAKLIRRLSTSLNKPQYQSLSTLNKIQQQPKQKKSIAAPINFKSQLSNTQNYIQKTPRQKLNQQKSNIQSLQQQLINPIILNPAQKRNKLIKDYGMSSIRKNKSLQINPKDVYRLEIQHLVSRPTQIQQMEDIEKLMIRLKRRYQHLRKFDQYYYSNLNQNQIAML